ncbi:MAG: translocation/assembly module TamB domain-containing protein [Spirochaetaceae bacterium]|jgi:hypothetical protein|nr:translocation/assembly module TamB domain-containing protein [Spirochaetaceae bacterium]
MSRENGLYIHIFLFIALVLITAALLKPLRNRLLDRAEVVRDSFIEKVETLSGRSVFYASMSPSILGTMDIKDIRLQGKEGDIFPYIGIKRLRARYSLAALLTGKPAFSAPSISVEEPFVEINAEKDLNELLRGGDGEGGGTVFESIKNIIKIAPENLILRISGGNVSLKAGEDAVKAVKIALHAQVNNDTLRFRLFSGAEIKLNAPLNIAAELSARVDGIYDAKNGKSGIRVSLNSVETSYFIIDKLDLLVNLTEDAVQLRKTGHREAYDLSINYSLTDAAFDGQAYFKDFRISRLLRFPAKFAALNNWTGTRISGNAGISFSKQEELVYTAVLQGVLDKSPIGNGSFSMDAGGGTESAYFNELDVSLPRGDIAWTGSLDFKPFMPNGVLSLTDLNLTKSGGKGNSNSLNGSFIVSSYGQAINFFAETFRIKSPEGAASGAPEETVELQAFDILVELGGGDIDFSASAFSIKNAEAYEEAVFSPISADGSFNISGQNMEIRVESESFSLYDMIKIAGCALELPDYPAQTRVFFDNILITSEVFVSTSPGELSYNLPHLIVVWQGGGDIWASFSLSGTKNNFELAESHLVWNGNGLDIAARGGFENENDMSFAAELRSKNNSYTLQATLLDKSAFYLSSSFGLTLNVNFASKNTFTGLLFMNSARFPMGDGYAELGVEADFRYDSTVSWMFNLTEFKISGIQSAFSSGADIELTGRVDQDGAEFDRIYFDDGRGAMYGGASGSWRGFFRHEEGTVTGNLNLRDSSGGETLDAQLRYADDSLFIWAETSGLQSGRFFNSADNMFITGGAGFFKTQENWSAAFDVSSLEGTFHNRPITLSGRGSLDNTSLTLGEIRFSYGNFFANLSFFNVDLQQSSLSSSARLWGETLEREFNADLSINASFTQTDSWLNIGTALQSFDGVMKFENTRFNEFESEDSFDFKFSRHGEIWNVEGGPEDMIRLRMNDEGDFFAALSYPSPALGTISGFIKDGNIDAEVSNLYIDVSTLYGYLPVDQLSIPGGFIIADVRLSGPLHDPEFFGTITANSLRVNIPSLLTDEIGPTPVFITFSGSEARIEPVSVRIGSGQSVLSGNMHISRWLPSSFNISLLVAQETPIPLNMNVAGFTLIGSAFGLINLGSDGQSLSVLGDVGSDNIEISPLTDEAEPQGERSAAPTIPIQTDIRITAGRKVEFLWPNADIPILQAYAAAGSSIRVTSDNFTGHFSINGDIDIRGGEVFYFQRSFYIKEGSMSFNESEIQFDPRFSVVAETRDRTNNEPVTISMIVENQSLRSFTPRFDATPALSQIEIFTLLGDKLSGTPDSENAIQRAFVSSTADILAQFGVVRQFEKNIRDFLHIDMFSLRTQALQNAILLNVFRDNAASASPAGEADAAQLQPQSQNQMQLGNYFDNTTVFLGKYIGAGLFLQAMLSLRYDPLGVGGMDGLLIEPDLSMEFKGPLFDIRWDLVPTRRENIWISDNKITLSKKWTLP